MREQFLLDPDVIFLNHGSFGACPIDVFEIYLEWQMELERQPVEFLGRRSSKLLEESRGILAEYLNTSPDNLVYITNATVGVNTVARSLKFEAGDEILTTNHEYGACDFTWQRVCELSGARYVRHHVPLPLADEHEFVESFWQSVTPRTRLIFISHMTSPTALIFPVEAICKRAREAGIPVFIDGAHIPGHLPLDLERLGVDYYTGNCHKWLCAPKGAAFLYVRPEHHRKLDANVISWGYDPIRQEGGTDFVEGSDLVRRHEWQGTRDIAAYLSVPAAIDFQKAHDWETVREECHALARRTLHRINELTGRESISPHYAFGQMVAISLPTCYPAIIKARLYDEYRIEVPLTTFGSQVFARVSFQGYNTESDADALVHAVGELFELA